MGSPSSGGSTVQPFQTMHANMYDYCFHLLHTVVNIPGWCHVSSMHVVTFQGQKMEKKQRSTDLDPHLLVLLQNPVYVFPHQLMVTEAARMNTHNQIHSCKHTHMHARMHACTHTHRLSCTHTHTHTHTHTQTELHTHTHTHTD